MAAGYECKLVFKSEKSGVLEYSVITNSDFDESDEELKQEVLDKRCSEFADMVCAHFGVARVFSTEGKE